MDAAVIGAVPHPPSSSLIPYLVGVIVVVGLVLIVVDRRGRRQSTHVDAASRHLPKSAGIRRYVDAKGAPPATRQIGPGPQIGRVVGSDRMLRATWEDTVVMVAGARTGKTTSVVIPAILAAPGACYVTSNKGDVTVTRRVRDRLGSVWLFDPQGLAGAAPPPFWWDPLDTAGTVAGARQLAGVFADATSGRGTRDAYFDPEGRDLLASLLLAAAASERPLTAVYGWLSDQSDDEPVRLLRAAGHDLTAKGLRGIIDLPDKQKAGVYGTAKGFMSWLADPTLAAWVTDQRSLVRFDAEAFVDSRDTLFSLSKEGPGSAGPLTLALTAAVLGAAERKAARSPAGRLPLPLLAVLDEAANVVRWQELPDLTSHTGSKGIVTMTFLQSWAQAVDVWGREGARKLWSSANVRVYGGGVTDLEFLDDVSRLCGEHDSPTRSSTSRAGQRTTTIGTRRERILDVAQLAALPKGRALVLLSGAHPVIVRTESCHDGPHASELQA